MSRFTNRNNREVPSNLGDQRKSSGFMRTFTVRNRDGSVEYEGFGSRSRAMVERMAAENGGHVETRTWELSDEPTGGGGMPNEPGSAGFGGYRRGGNGNTVRQEHHSDGARLQAWGSNYGDQSPGRSSFTSGRKGRSRFSGGS